MNQNNKEKSNKCNCERGLCCFGKPSTEKCKCPPLQQEKEEIMCEKLITIAGGDVVPCHNKLPCPLIYHSGEFENKISELEMSADKGEGKLPSERITEIFKERCKKYGKDEVGWTSGIIFIEAILKYLDEQSNLSTKI